MSHYSMRVAWSEQDGMFVATCPALGNVSALGSTPHAAVAELEAAVALALETYAAEGWHVPEHDTHEDYSGQFRLRLPRSIHAWLAHEAERQSVSLNTLVATLLAQAIGGADARGVLSDEIESLRAALVSAMRTAFVEMTADSSTSLDREAQPSDYVFEGSPTSTLRLLDKVG